MKLHEKQLSDTINRGAWAAAIVETYHGPRVCIFHPGGFLTSWPVQYETGEIGYDFNPPRDCQRATRAAFKALSLGVAE